MLKEGAANQDEISFVDKKKHSIENFLEKVPNLKRIVCDEDLEKFLIERFNS